MSTTWCEAIQGFIVWLAAGGRAPATRELRRYHLASLADTVPGGPLTATEDDLTAWLGNDDWSANTRRSARASVVGFFRWLHVSGRRADDPAALLPTVPGVLGKPRPCPEAALKSAVIAAGPRERLMLALAAGVGLRRAEVARTRVDDVTATLDGPTLRVVGKGGRVRSVPISDELADAIAARGRGWLFPNVVTGEPLTPAHVGKCISRLLPPGWTTHTLRHRFASAAYRQDRDIRAVQELLGHASVATTQIYTEIPDDARRRAALHAAAGLRVA